MSVANRTEKKPARYVVAEVLAMRPDHRLIAIAEIEVRRDLLLQVGRAAVSDPKEGIEELMGVEKRPEFLIQNNLRYQEGRFYPAR
jgi:hypothetical protein